MTQQLTRFLNSAESGHLVAAGCTEFVDSHPVQFHSVDVQKHELPLSGNFVAIKRACSAFI